jgi:protease-4
LLESWFEQMVRAIVSGRKLSQERVRWLIDQAPWEALAAFEHGLIDGVLYEDELPAFLGSAGKAAVLKPYAQIRSLLLHRLHRRSDRAIGVISLQGSIMPGVSQNFPLPLPVFGEHTAGSATVQQMVRAARKDESLAAVILHIDSPGGSASASDLMWRDLLLLGQEKPLIIYMGDVAASGGYYVAAPGAKIVAQAATLTGSIGVFIAKGVTSELYAKIDARRQVIQRGENAGLYSELSLWSPNERAKVQANLDTIYREFKERVAEGRKLPYETLDEICGGRVWTGEQAQAHGLVDALGDFTVAVELARQAAHLPADQDVPLVVIQPAKRFLPAEPVSKSLQRLGEVLLLGKVEKLTLGQHVWLWADGLPSVKE